MTESRRLLWLITILLCGLSNSLFSAVWPSGASGNLLDTGAWGGSTFGAGDTGTIHDGNVHLGTDEDLQLPGTTFDFGQDSGSNANVSMSGGNLLAQNIKVGVNGNAMWSVLGGNIQFTGSITFGQNASSSANAHFSGSNLYLPERTLTVAQAGSANVMFKDSRVDGLNNFNVATSSTGVGVVHGYGSNITTKVLTVGGHTDTRSGNVHFENCNISGTNVNGSNMKIGSGGTSYLYTQGVQITDFQKFLLSSGSGFNSEVVMNNTSVAVTSTQTGALGFGWVNSGTGGSINAIMTHCTFTGPGNGDVGKNASHAKVRFVDTDLTANGTFTLWNSPYSLPEWSLRGGNVAVKIFQHKGLGSKLILEGGKGTFSCNSLSAMATGSTCRHLISKDRDSGEHIGHILVHSGTTRTSTNLQLGVLGGAVLASSNLYHVQKGTSNVSDLSVYSSNTSGYDLSLVSGLSGSHAFGIRAQMAESKKQGSVNVVSRTGLSTSGAMGFVEVPNLSPGSQMNGLTVHMKLSSGDVSTVMSGLSDAGYSCKLSTASGYDLQFSVPSSDLPTGMGYFLWDFRDHETEVSYAELSQLMIVANPSGCLFSLR